MTAPSIKPWTAEETMRACARAREHPTRRDGLASFARFIEHDGPHVTRHAGRPGFLGQQAHNFARDGAIGEQAGRRTAADHRSAMLLADAGSRPPHNPHPSVVRVLEHASQYVPTGEGQYGSDRRTSDYRAVVALSADGRRAISASYDATIRVWSVEEGLGLHTLVGRVPGGDGGARCPELIQQVAITPDGRVAASRTLDGEVRLWDVEAAGCLSVLRGPDGSRLSYRGGPLALTPDGRVVYSADSRGVDVWNVAEGAHGRTELPVDSGRDAVAILVELGWAVSLDASGRAAIVWDIASGRTVQTFEGHGDFVRDVVITPDGRLALTASQDGLLRVWDCRSGRLVWVFQHPDYVCGCLVTSDGQWALSSAADGVLRTWDLRSGACLRTLAFPDDASATDGSMAMSADGGTLVTAGADARVVVWDPVHGAADEPAGTASRLARRALGRDGAHAITLAPGDRDIDQVLVVSDPGTGAERWRLEGHGQAVLAVAVTPDDTRAVSWSQDKTIAVWDLESGLCLRRDRSDALRVEVMLPSPDGRGVVMWDRGEDVRLWDVETGAPVRAVRAHYVGNPIYRALTPDGRVAVLGCREDNRMHFWDLEKRVTLPSLRGTIGSLRIWSWALSPDGRHAVSASVDCTVGIWDVGAGSRVRTLSGHTHWVHAAVVTADGRHVVSSSDDRTIRVWDFETGECLAVAGQPDVVHVLATRGSAILSQRTGGQVTWSRVRNLETGPAIVTPVRRFDRRRSAWDDHLTVRCPACDHGAPVVPAIVSAIESIGRAVALAEDQIPCLAMPREAWCDPGLVSVCAACGQPMRASPFALDHRAFY